MKTAVILFPGSNCDHDAHHVISRVLGQTADVIWHKERRDLSDYELPRLFAVLNTPSLDELWGNLVVLLRQGRSEEEVLEYAVEFALLDADFLRTFIQSLRAPLSQLYAFTYAQGKRLMLPLLGGPDRLEVIRRLLTEPVYPSLLEEWAST